MRPSQRQSLHSSDLALAGRRRVRPVWPARSTNICSPAEYVCSIMATADSPICGTTRASGCSYSRQPLRARYSSYGLHQCGAGAGIARDEHVSNPVAGPVRQTSRPAPALGYRIASSTRSVCVAGSSQSSVAAATRARVNATLRAMPIARSVAPHVLETQDL
jgi:hypothetical protein